MPGPAPVFRAKQTEIIQKEEGIREKKEDYPM
jgi:hypothetical protein